MTEISIDTARGITLAATLCVPDTADPLDLPELSTALEAGRTAPARHEGAVILAHTFLTDRHGLAHRLDELAARYRKAGLTTLQFDFSGLGESDDDVITLAGEIEDSPGRRSTPTASARPPPCWPDRSRCAPSWRSAQWSARSPSCGRTSSPPRRSTSSTATA